MVSPYDDFAWFYNKYWAPDVAADFLHAADRLLLKRLRPNAHILDLCCGTGQLAASLTARNFRVTGLDSSRAMLNYARRNAPEANFLRAEVTDFRLLDKADGATALFDSFNHLLTPGSLRAALSCTHDALSPGASLVFDLNTERGFQDHLRDHFIVNRKDAVLALQGDYDFDEKLARFDGTVFRRRGASWRRNDFRIVERCYDPKAVVRVLAEVGFSGVRILDAARDVKLKAHTGRMFFVARKSRARAR